MTREIRVLSDPQELSRAAADEFVRLAEEATRARGLFSVALAGGSTPKMLYALLATDAYHARVPWDNVHLFWGDERHVPPDHKDSNFRMTQETLLAKAPVPAANIHRVKSENPDARKAADEYERELRDFFTAHRLLAGGLPRFDLVLLGMGPDGHTASLFPGTHAVREREHWVAAPWVDKFQTYRITLTPPVLNNAAYILFFVSGEEKAETLRIVLEGAEESDRYPSQVIHPANGTLRWLVDRAAARLLRNTQ
jgi:6-phosphogluconolactonase